MLARMEAEITVSMNRGIKCEKWAITHDAKISWATDKINKARSERKAMRATIEELAEQVKQLTTRLDQGELQVKILEGICTFRAAPLQNQFLDLQERRNYQSSMTNSASTTSEPAPLSSMISQSIHPIIVREGGVEPHPGPAPVDPAPEVLRPASPEVLEFQDFYNTDAQARSSPRPDSPTTPRDPRSTLTMSTSREAGLLRKSILRRLEHLRRIIDQPVNEDTNLEKLKSLQTGVIPRVEKVVLELEMAQQPYFLWGPGRRVKRETT